MGQLDYVLNLCNVVRSTNTNVTCLFATEIYPQKLLKYYILLDAVGRYQDTLVLFCYMISYHLVVKT